MTKIEFIKAVHAEFKKCGFEKSPLTALQIVMMFKAKKTTEQVIRAGLAV